MRALMAARAWTRSRIALLRCFVMGKLPQRRRDSRARGLRSAHDQGGIDETGFWIARVGRAKAEPRKVKRRGREAA
jgi:hypothetical protein